MIGHPLTYYRVLKRNRISVEPFSVRVICRQAVQLKAVLFTIFLDRLCRPITNDTWTLLCMLGVRRLQKMSMQRWLVLFDRLPKVALALCAGAASRLLSAVRLLSYSEEKEDSKSSANFDRPVPWEALLGKNTWMCLNFVRKIGHHRSEMLPGDVARKPAPRALPPSIPRPLCCRIDYTEEEQESGNDVEHKQANTGRLAHSGVK